MYVCMYVCMQVRMYASCPQAKLSMVASERDFAVGEMRQMAEQCQSVAGEFEQMAKHCDQLMTDLEQVRSCDIMHVTHDIT